MSCAGWYWIFYIMEHWLLIHTVCYSLTCCGLLISGRLYTIVWRFCAPPSIKRLQRRNRNTFLKSLNIYDSGQPKNQVWFDKYSKKPASILKLFRMINDQLKIFQFQTHGVQEFVCGTDTSKKSNRPISHLRPRHRYMVSSRNQNHHCSFSFQLANSYRGLECMDHH